MSSPSSTLTERHSQAVAFLEGTSRSTTTTSRTTEPKPTPTTRRRPHVTLTFAQTIDGCIAGVDGQQLILSGEESMCMTHV